MMVGREGAGPVQNCALRRREVAAGHEDRQRRLRLPNCSYSLIDQRIIRVVLVAQPPVALHVALVIRELIGRAGPM